MKVIKLSDLINTEREVFCPKGGFVSRRYLLAKDGAGFSVTNTLIPVNGKQYWHYKNHLEACLCIKGKGKLYNKITNETFDIVPNTMYYLDKNDPHEFEALEECELICIFNPPLNGLEIHKKDGSY